jgi:uncharacterized protein
MDLLQAWRKAAVGRVIGRIGGQHWSVVVTYREGRTRIISARRSRKEKVALYEG